MYKKISKTDEINARLQQEGKIHLMNTDKDLQKMIDMNQIMDEARYEHQDFVLKFCPTCIQMTNHLSGICQKCRIK
jgi:hypothetical protein